MRVFLQISEIATHLGVTQRRAYQLAKEGKIPATEVAGRLRVPRDAWEAWLHTQTQRATANLIQGGN